MYSKYTCVASSVAHVCRNQTPLVRGGIIKLYRRQVTGAVVSSNNIQQSINAAVTCTGMDQMFYCKVKNFTLILECVTLVQNIFSPAFLLHMFMSQTSLQELVCGS